MSYKVRMASPLRTETQERLKKLDRVAKAAQAYMDVTNELADQDDPEKLRPFYDELQAALEDLVGK
jgi:hypothetical protein